MKFKREDLQEMLWDEGGSLEKIQDKIIENSRWSILHSIIFKFDNKFYKSNYSIGSTEYQNERPWEYDEDEVECEEVVPVEKKVIIYEPIKQ